MTTFRGINPKYLDKLDPDQKVAALTQPGQLFLNDFVFLKGNHCFVIGTTGSGKTNKGYWLVNWLKHTETQIWMDSGKSDEIIPLLCQGCPVQLIVPKYTDVIIEERKNGKWQKIENHPAVVQVPDAGDTWWAIKKKTINILCFRNAFWTTSARADWMTELFSTIAAWTRLRRMPAIFPCSIHIDESQWVLAGTRISRDSDRVKSSEIITENALEIRSSQGRLIMYAQDFTNIPPAIRENLVCAILCRGADVSSDQSKKLSPHCNPINPSVKRPANFKRHEGKFVTEDGRCAPVFKPWTFALFPKSEEDRKWCSRCRVRYVGFNDQRPEESEVEEECQPELGRFSAMAIPPEKIEGIGVGRYDAIEGENE
jgi:hypothetical protein